MKKIYLSLLAILIVVLISTGVALSEAEIIVDSLSDVPNWLSIRMEETNFSMSNWRRFDVMLEYNGTEYSGFYTYNMQNGEINTEELDFYVQTGESITLVNAKYSFKKNRFPVYQNYKMDKCTLVVAPDSDESLVAINGHEITFLDTGDITVRVQYLSLDPWLTAIKYSGSWVTLNLHIGKTVDMYETGTNNEIDTLIHTFGSYSWKREEEEVLDENSNYDYSKLDIDITVYEKNSAVLKDSIEVTLPTGFSFEKNTIAPKKRLVVSRQDGKTLISERVTVYPIYSEDDESILTYVYNGKQFELPFRIDDNADAGKILMRPTSKVNRNDSQPFVLETTIDPVSDFIEGETDDYSDQLAALTCMMSQAVYNENRHEEETPSYTIASFLNLGFSRILWQRSIDNHDVAAGFAQKKVIDEDGNIYTVVLAAVRGTVGYEWIGNFKVSDGSPWHADFMACSDNLRKRLTAYLKAIDAYNLPRGKLKIVICGHSRAGAVVDIAAHDLNTIYGQDNIYAYTYAAPNSTKYPVEDTNIFNTVYKYDFVGYLPLDYHKYGVTRAVGGEHPSDAPPMVRKLFSTYTNGNEFKGVGAQWLIHVIASMPELIKKGSSHLATNLDSLLGCFLIVTGVDDNFVAKAHGAENYCAWVMSDSVLGSPSFSEFIDSQKNVALTGGIAIATIVGGVVGVATPAGRIAVGLAVGGAMLTNGILKLYGFHCPVDIEVLDGAGNVVATIVNHHEKDITIDDIVVYADGETTFIAIPGGISHTIRVTGTGSGSMTIDYAHLNESLECDIIESTESIPVHKGERFMIRGAESDDSMPLISSNYGYTNYTVTYDDILVLPMGIKDIADEAFMNIKAEKIIIPESCKSIGSRAFANCRNLKEIEFKNGNLNVAKDFLSGCSEDLVIIAPEGSTVTEEQSVYRAYLGR